MKRTIAVAVAAVLTAASASRASDVARAGDHEVVNIDSGPGRRLVIVREGDAGDGGAAYGQRHVLDYRDATGARVRVYADRPVTRAEVEARLDDAHREAERARTEGRRAAEEGRRAAEEGRRAGELARREGEQARAEGARAADEGRQAAEMARRDADQARQEAQRTAAEARREAEQAREEATEGQR